MSICRFYAYMRTWPNSAYFRSIFRPVTVTYFLKNCRIKLACLISGMGSLLPLWNNIGCFRCCNRVPSLMKSLLETNSTSIVRILLHSVFWRCWLSGRKAFSLWNLQQWSWNVSRYRQCSVVTAVQRKEVGIAKMAVIVVEVVVFLFCVNEKINSCTYSAISVFAVLNCHWNKASFSLQVPPAYLQKFSQVNK